MLALPFMRELLSVRVTKGPLSMDMGGQFRSGSIVKPLIHSLIEPMSTSCLKHTGLSLGNECSKQVARA